MIPGAMADSAGQSNAGEASRWWPRYGPRCIPTSTDRIIASEERLLLSLVETKYTREQVNIGTGPEGSKVRWSRSSSSESSFINTVTFESQAGAPTLVMVHGFGASLGLFYRNFDALASHFQVIAIDQLGWGGSSRPDFTCTSTEETEAWFIDSFEEWRKSKNLSNFILLGHSFGGYVAAKYALKHPEHVRRLVLVGPSGVTLEQSRLNQLTNFRATWMGALVNYLWKFNFTPQDILRGLGPWGPGLVKNYISDRFVSNSRVEESKLLTDYVYRTLAAKASGELCLKHIFSFHTFAQCGPEWKVPTTVIYGCDDWMDYREAQQAREAMKNSSLYEIIRVPKGGHFVFIDNPSGFHSAVLHACRHILQPDQNDQLLPPELISA